MKYYKVARYERILNYYLCDNLYALEKNMSFENSNVIVLFFGQIKDKTTAIIWNTCFLYLTRILLLKKWETTLLHSKLFDHEKLTLISIIRLLHSKVITSFVHFVVLKKLLIDANTQIVLVNLAITNIRFFFII